MDVNLIKSGLVSGEFFILDKKLFTKEEYFQIKEVQAQEELYDLLQLTKKIQL